MGIGNWISYYNGDRPHSSLGGRTPDEVYFGRPELGVGPFLPLPASQAA